MENFHETVQHTDSNAFRAMELLNDEKRSLEEINVHTEEDIPFDPIKEKIEEVRVMVIEYNLFINHTGKELTERAIRLGLVLLELKSLVKMSDESWEDWAQQNLPFIGKRNRQKYMLLAKRNDCHQYTHLGLERLEMLASTTKNDSDNEDPIGAFMLKHGITADETTEVNLEEFKTQVDVSLNKEKLERRHIQVSPEVVEAATREGKTFDTGFLKRLSNIQRDGGDPEAFLRDPSSMRKEKEESEPPVEEECEHQVEDKAEGFKTLAAEMIRTVDDILQCPDQILKIETNSIDELIEKLTELQTAATMNTEQAEAA